MTNVLPHKNFAMLTLEQMDHHNTGSWRCHRHFLTVKWVPSRLSEERSVNDVTCVMRSICLLFAWAFARACWRVQRNAVLHLQQHYQFEPGGLTPPHLLQQFHVLAKCSGKLDWLICYSYENSANQSCTCKLTQSALKSLFSHPCNWLVCKRANWLSLS